MPSICFYFQVHQPRRIKRYRMFDVGNDHNYFNDTSRTKVDNRFIVDKVALKCYLPTNRLMLLLLRSYPDFRICYSLSGIFLDQLEEYAPEVLKSFQALVATGQVELLSETYYHSLAFLYSMEEFLFQVEQHRKAIKRLFGVTPKVFRNTELIYSDAIALLAEEMGYDAILAEGVDHILGSRSPNFVYRPQGSAKIKLLLKNYRLSDDIAFRFGERTWSEWPLTIQKFADWITAANGNGDVVNLFMDYETFGEHQWEDTGIFDFLRDLPAAILSRKDNNFVTPTEAAHRYEARDTLSVPHYVSWADVERDLSAWRGNEMQHDALNKLYELREKALESKDEALIEDWRRLTTSDHFYYMCTKWWQDGDVHTYFSPYDSPYDAYIGFVNVLADLRFRIDSEVNR